MTSDKYIATLRQIQAIVNEALREGSSALGSKKRAQRAAPQLMGSTAQLSFDMNILAFMNQHAKGLSGPKKFTLLVARMVKGSTTAQVSYQDIRVQWNKMRTVLGGDFNPAHSNRAKAQGWVDSGKKAMWNLASAWKDALV
jgi:hypothetical protein